MLGSVYSNMSFSLVVYGEKQQAQVLQAYIIVSSTWKFAIASGTQLSHTSWSAFRNRAQIIENRSNKTISENNVG